MKKEQGEWLNVVYLSNDWRLHRSKYEPSSGAAGSTRCQRKGTRVTIHVGGVGEVNPTMTKKPASVVTNSGMQKTYNFQMTGVNNPTGRLQENGSQKAMRKWR